MRLGIFWLEGRTEEDLARGWHKKKRREECCPRITRINTNEEKIFLLLTPVNPLRELLWSWFTGQVAEEMGFAAFGGKISVD